MRCFLNLIVAVLVVAVAALSNSSSRAAAAFDIRNRAYFTFWISINDLDLYYHVKCDQDRAQASFEVMSRSLDARTIEKVGWYDVSDIWKRDDLIAISEENKLPALQKYVRSHWHVLLAEPAFLVSFEFQYDSRHLYVSDLDLTNYGLWPAYGGGWDSAVQDYERLMSRDQLLVHSKAGAVLGFLENTYLRRFDAG